MKINKNFTVAVKSVLADVKKGLKHSVKAFIMWFGSLNVTYMCPSCMIPPYVLIERLQREKENGVSLKAVA